MKAYSYIFCKWDCRNVDEILHEISCNVEYVIIIHICYYHNEYSTAVSQWPHNKNIIGVYNIYNITFYNILTTLLEQTVYHMWMLLQYLSTRVVQ